MEVGSLKLEEYLSCLEVGVDAKRKHRKAITEFQAMLAEQGKVAPASVDYDTFTERLTAEGKTEATARDSANKARKYFAWLEQARKSVPAGSVGVEVTAKGKQRFCLVIPPLLREQLELLALYDGCSITEIIIKLCAKGAKERAGDIEYIRDFKHGLDARKAGRL